MNQTHKKRLLNVAKALREAPEPKYFKMSTFANGSSDWTGEGEPPENFCGTPACALGHYAARRDLQREFKIWTDKRYGYAGILARSDGSSEFEAAAEHFGLTYDPYDGDGEVYELFAPSGCGGAKTPKQAARYIERFVARKEKEGAK